MPSRTPRSATRRRPTGKSRQMAARMAQPATTRSARSRPMQGMAARSSQPMPARLSLIRSMVAKSKLAPSTLGAVVARQLEMHAAERGDGARRAEHLQLARAMARLAQLRRGAEFPQQRHGLFHHGLVDRRRDAAGAMALGQHHHPHGNGMGGCEARRRAGCQLEAADLRRAAADIEGERPARRGHQQRRAAGEGQRGLLVIADDLDLDPGLAPDPADELGAIVGAPAGLGGDAAGMGHALAAHLAGADLEGLDGAVHGGAGERAAAHPAPRPGGRFARTRRRRGTPRLAAAPPATGSCWCRGRARPAQPRRRRPDSPSCDGRTPGRHCRSTSSSPDAGRGSRWSAGTHFRDRS